MEIKVDLQQLGTSFMLKVEPKYTLFFVKTIVQSRHYIHKSNQCLTKNGHTLRDSFTLSEYDIKNNDSVTLTISGPSPYKPYTIYYKVDGKERDSIEVMTCHTIDYLKKDIWYKTGIPVKCMRLRYLTYLLESGSCIADYNILPESTLSLEADYS
ncbi:hypothetical protein BDF21DRAFT_431181 [Thamnidium elegans]|uniref:Ubiquitin-like domain-containing protein n=1 Tax=Thamnidium elegans TaxID=101142 RepID=A0A8H7SI49_9FUNG|nr:hypothetical protein INT48_000002 [Thamnidium elegans]KAI8054848.1 hypothetical protein BDF21DRAFT_431181 [Thamnidium elegans]